MKFNEVFNKYLNLIGCNSKEVAKSVNLSESIISRYKNGTRQPNDETMKKISKALSELSNGKYNTSDIYKEFSTTMEDNSIDFEIVRGNLNILIDVFNINVRKLAKVLNFDASYLSRIRSGERVPSDKEEFVNALAKFIFEKYDVKTYKESFLSLFKDDNITLNTISEWIINNKTDKAKEINNFLSTLDEFNLSDYIKAIKFDKLKVPSIPFYKCKCRNYYGIEEMKMGELDFFKATVFSKAKDDIFMCSDMPMEDMAKDIEFGKKWMFAIAMCLKKGLHLNIIHNLGRPFNEMMLGLESWIPIYMTGQVSPFYLKDVKNNVYGHLNYTSSSCCLYGECIKGYHDKGKYYLTNKDKEMEYYKNKAQFLLKKANSLMDIYNENNMNMFQLFLLNDEKVNCDRKRILNSLPLFTIDDGLLDKILKRNNVSKEDINKIKKYKTEEEKRVKKILNNNKITDVIYDYAKEANDDFDVYLSVENIFYNKKINYSIEEYRQHLKATLNYNNPNYNVVLSEVSTFNNITITMLDGSYVVISKSCNPVIHFVIRHPKLVEAINNFKPLVIEKHD